VITNNIVLVGFMGTGKSTVGRLLAERLGWNFLDSDAAIEHMEQTSISEIFRLHGEAHFRQLESQALANILAESGQVLATGGGAVLAEINRACMLQNGCVVALQAEPEIIIARVSCDQNRPLLQGNLEERVNSLMETRKHAYDFATIAIDTTELTVEQIVEEIMAKTGLNVKEGQA